MFKFLDFLFHQRADEIALRTLPEDGFVSLLQPYFVPATRPSTIMLLPFSNAKVRAAIHEAKYHGNAHAFELLAHALSTFLTRPHEDFHEPVLIPVPLGKNRRRDRGFNQVEEVILCALRTIQKDNEGSFTLDTSLLERALETTSQVSLPRAKREKNMRGSFKATRRADPTRTYLLIDDVLTTGATLQSAIEALKSAGATRIVPLALAH